MTFLRFSILIRNFPFYNTPFRKYRIWPDGLECNVFDTLLADFSKNQPNFPRFNIFKQLRGTFLSDLFYSDLNI
jgi:hypothetical protein